MSENVMRKVQIEKITLNFGAGREQKHLEKGVLLIEQIAGVKPMKTITQKRIPTWSLRPGLPVGAKLTLRGKKAAEVLARLLAARDLRLPESCVDNAGNISFGIPEYIDIPETKYDPKIGIIGLQVSVTLQRPGYRVQKRKLYKARVGKKQRVTREDAKAFMKESFKTEFGEQ